MQHFYEIVYGVSVGALKRANKVFFISEVRQRVRGFTRRHRVPRSRGRALIINNRHFFPGDPVSGWCRTDGLGGHLLLSKAPSLPSTAKHPSRQIFHPPVLPVIKTVKL